jgi:isoleucyl-tRNA synthetase
MPELERYMLHLPPAGRKLKRAVDDFDFNAYTRLLADFANDDLSAFYFDIRKDVLYCDVNALTGEQSERRRAYRSVLDILFHAMVRWCAPVLVFTTEEVWATRFPDAGRCTCSNGPGFHGSRRTTKSGQGFAIFETCHRTHRAAPARKGDWLQSRSRSDGPWRS